VYTNGADPGANYVIHIDQMQQDLVVCKAGAGSHRTGSFFVGAELFNAQEMQTINNNNPSLALQRLDVRVYDLTGSPALISTAFYFILRIKERRAWKKKQLNRFFHTEIFTWISNNPQEL
jgi:hypothetical protein